jgi:hypothetical protein
LFLRIMSPMKLSVECHSGRKAHERPVRFRLDEKQYQVEAVLDQLYDPEHVFYRFEPILPVPYERARVPVNILLFVRWVVVFAANADYDCKVRCVPLLFRGHWLRRGQANLSWL